MGKETDAMKWILIIAAAVCIVLLIVRCAKPQNIGQSPSPDPSHASDGAQNFAPFLIVEGTSVVLNVSDYPTMMDLFLTREEDGFLGNGYDWEALAGTYLREKCDAEMRDAISFDSEAEMFCAYAEEEAILMQFVAGFAAFCQDTAAVQDLLSRTEPG